MERLRTPAVEALFVLLRNALGGDSRPVLLDGPGWEEMLDMAREQTVTGLVFQGVSRLPSIVKVPDQVLFRLMMEADRIKRRSTQVQAAARQLVTQYREAGLHPVLLKGPSIAALYPEPLLRESGDIDFYFPPEEFEAAARMTGDRPAPDGSVHGTQDGIDIDLHRHYFDLHVRAERLPEVTSPEAVLLMLSAHIRKHCMGAGIGLRQLCDMAVAYRALDFDKDRLEQVYRQTGTLRWNRLLSAFLNRWLGADAPFGGGTDPAPLLRIVHAGGNFGHHATSRKEALQHNPFRRKLDTSIRFLRRLPFSLRYAPQEFLPTVGDLFRGNLQP